MIDVIYLTGGKGYRTGLGYAKQYYLLGGKPMLIHGLETLKQIKEIGKIIIPSDDFNKVCNIVHDYNIKSTIIDGGKTRQESVYEGLKFITTKYVLIMESVRPFCPLVLINKVIDYKSDFITPLTRMNASVLTLDGETFDREKIGMVMMPQKYRTELLHDTHSYAKKHNIQSTDDADLVIKIANLKPDTFFGPEYNIKVTTAKDLLVAELLYKADWGVTKDE